MHPPLLSFIHVSEVYLLFMHFPAILVSLCATTRDSNTVIPGSKGSGTTRRELCSGSGCPSKPPSIPSTGGEATEKRKRTRRAETMLEAACPLVDA